MNDAAAGPRTSAEAEVHQGQHHAQEGDDQRDHFGEASALGPPFAWAPAYAEAYHARRRLAGAGRLPRSAAHRDIPLLAVDVRFLSKCGRVLSDSRYSLIGELACLFSGKNFRVLRLGNLAVML